MVRVLVISVVVLAAAACSSGGSSAASSSHSSPVSSTTSPPPAPTQTPILELTRCPVTRPGGPRPPTVLPAAPHVGNGHLWVGLWPHGLVIVPPGDVRRDGSLRMKFMWYRGRGAHGMLHISGREIGSGARVRGQTFGYGRSGFNPSSIFFPGQGCFRVTGTAGRAALTFVTEVRTCSVLPELPRARRKAFAAWCAA